jgi:hypothetical protein
VLTPFSHPAPDAKREAESLSEVQMMGCRQDGAIIIGNKITGPVLYFLARGKRQEARELGRGP